MMFASLAQSPDGINLILAILLFAIILLKLSILLIGIKLGPQVISDVGDGVH